MSDDKKPSTYSDKERIDAMDSKFDAVKYQEQGQGKPEKGLKKDEEE